MAGREGGSIHITTTVEISPSNIHVCIIHDKLSQQIVNMVPRKAQPPSVALVCFLTPELYGRQRMMTHTVVQTEAGSSLLSSSPCELPGVARKTGPVGSWHHTPSSSG